MTEARRSPPRSLARVVTDAVAWARDIVNEPSLTKSPEDFAASAKKLLAGKGVTVTVLTEAQIRAQKMGGVIGVGQGSERPPRFVKVTYDPPGGKARGTLAFVGKGVTFDTGGISIKPADGMEAMKTDMGGAAAALGAMSALKALGVRHRVVSYTPMVENMPSGIAIRPGDVLRMRDGQTVEVLNTDAEGRLILADALAWAVEDQVDAIVDLATLTGACVVALGEKVAGSDGQRRRMVGAGPGRGRPRRGTDVAPAVARRLSQEPRVRGRRPPQHRHDPIRRRAHRRAVPRGVRRRSPVGAPRHRGARPRVVRRR